MQQTSRQDVANRKAAFEAASREFADLPTDEARARLVSAADLYRNAFQSYDPDLDTDSVPGDYGFEGWG